MIPIIPSWFSTLIFLPGRMCHGYITKSIVSRYDIEIYSLNYLEIDPNIANVMHRAPTSFREKSIIVLAPFVFNIFVSLLGFSYALSLQEDATGLFLLGIYIGCAFAYTSFPTKEIAHKLWIATIQEFKKGEVLAYLVFLPVALIRLIKFLSFFSAQFFFVVVIFIICSLFVKNKVLN